MDDQQHIDALAAGLIRKYQELEASLIEAYDVLYKIACQPSPAPWTREEMIEAATTEVLQLMKKHGRVLRARKK